MRTGTNTCAVRSPPTTSASTAITGTTDSEWVDALLLSQLDDPGGWHSGDALLSALVRAANARFLSLWYTTGGSFHARDGRWGMWGERAEAAVIASEPLTHDTTGWVEVPEYGAIVVSRSEGGVQVRTEELHA
ncbi:MAG: glutamine amidotransferase [Myxococcota bacterium]